MKTKLAIIAAGVALFAGIALADVAYTYVSAEAKVNSLCFYPTYTNAAVTSLRAEVCGYTKTSTGTPNALIDCAQATLTSGSIFTGVKNLINASDTPTGAAIDLYKTKVGL